MKRRNFLKSCLALIGASVVPMTLRGKEAPVYVSTGHRIDFGNKDSGSIVEVLIEHDKYVVIDVIKQLP